MLLFMPPYCRCHSDMYDDIRLHYGDAVTSQLFWLAPPSDEILDVVTSKLCISLVFLYNYSYITMHGAKNIICDNERCGCMLSSFWNVNFSRKTVHYEVNVFRLPATEFPLCYRIDWNVSSVQESLAMWRIEDAPHCRKYIKLSGLQKHTARLTTLPYSMDWFTHRRSDLAKFSAPPKLFCKIIS
jgi:hypothetical protein